MINILRQKDLDLKKRCNSLSDIQKKESNFQSDVKTFTIGIFKELEKTNDFNEYEWLKSAYFNWAFYLEQYYNIYISHNIPERDELKPTDAISYLKNIQSLLKTFQEETENQYSRTKGLIDEQDQVMHRVEKNIENILLKQYEPISIRPDVSYLKEIKNDLKKDIQNELLKIYNFIPKELKE